MKHLGLALWTVLPSPRPGVAGGEQVDPSALVGGGTGLGRGAWQLRDPVWDPEHAEVSI